MADTVPSMELGERIRSVADAKDISLNEVSRRSGVERSHLARILSGKTANPGIKTIASIAEALGVTVDYLLVGVDDVGELGDLSVDDLARRLLALGRLDGELTEALAVAESSEEYADTPRDGAGADSVSDEEADTERKAASDQ